MPRADKLTEDQVKFFLDQVLHYDEWVDGTNPNGVAIKLKKTSWRGARYLSIRKPTVIRFMGERRESFEEFSLNTHSRLLKVKAGLNLGRELADGEAPKL